MKIVDTDVTHPDRMPTGLDVSEDADTHASPGLRPEVLGDAAQRRTRAIVHAALFKDPGVTTTIGPYQVLSCLGEGGMGVVYAAYDDKLERKVALKLIRGAALRRPEGRARTLREARALARVSHPNVVHVYQVGEVDDEIFVAMELLKGPTLRAWLTTRPRTWREVLAVFRQAGDGLAAAHRQGVIHRDFKPANVIVGDDGRVRVLDFGLAHFSAADHPGAEDERQPLAPAGELTDPLLTQTGAVLGTPAYMAAEQFTGARGDAKTDQFSFCTALYEALYGQRPFAGDKLDALASAVIDGRVQPLKTRHQVPLWLHRVVMRGLQPDPASRWPAMDGLLLALAHPEARVGRGLIAGVAAGASALLLGGLGYALTREAPPLLAVAAVQDEDEDEAAQRHADAMRSHDERVLMEARAASTSDPVRTIHALARLAGDHPETWQQAQFLADTAAVRGLPTQVLRTGDRPLAEVQPLADGGFVGRDDLGAVWHWKVSQKPGTQIAMADAATRVLAARDVPVWAAVTGESIVMFGADRAQTIAIGDSVYSGWQLASDGRTLVASTQSPPTPTSSWISTVHLWDLTQPGSPPRTIALPPETLAVIADDASIVLARAAKGIEVIRPHEGTRKLLKYRGTPWALSADRRFAVAQPDERAGMTGMTGMTGLTGLTGLIDVLEIATGKSRQVEAEAVTVLVDADVLFTRTEYGRPFVRRESLATGAVAWRLPLSAQAGPLARRLVVDPAHDQFAASLGDTWGIGDLRRGQLTSFVTVPKDSYPQWAGAGTLMVATDEVRIHRPEASPVQLRQRGSGCGLAPGGRWAVVLPWSAEDPEYTRVDLKTKATTSFRCPTRPKTDDDGGFFTAGVTALIDDQGQIAMSTIDGWSCWWDPQHGARTGTMPAGFGWVVAMPRGLARSMGAEVELWSGPQDSPRRWTAAGPVADLVPSPSGALLAVRSEQGVQVLHVDTGAVTTVNRWPTAMGKAELNASALAWSPDNTRLAVLDKVDGALELSVWDVVGEPREVGPENHVTLGGHVLKDSPGRPRNYMAFTPAGTAVALTHRHESLLLVDLATHETRRLDAPDLHAIHMRSETAAIGIDLKNTPVMLDFAARASSSLTPDLETGGSTRPPIRRSEDGSVWTCAALGPGTLIEIAAMDSLPPQELRARLLDLAESL